MANQQPGIIRMAERIRAESLTPGGSVISVVRDANSFIYSEERSVPLFFKNYCLGFVKTGPPLSKIKSTGLFDYMQRGKDRWLCFKKRLTPAMINSELEQVIDIWRRGGHYSCLADGAGVRVETRDLFGTKTNFEIDSGAAEIFGIMTFSLGVVGFQRIGEDRRAWIVYVGKRSSVAVHSPAKLQNLVNVDLPAGCTGRESLAEKTYEAISLQPEHFKNLRSCGIICHSKSTPSGILRRCVHVYELDLTDSPGFTPQVASPVVEKIEKVPVKLALDQILGGLFDPTHALVILDFAVRHGILTPDNEENYYEVVRGLRSDIPKPFINKQ